MLHLSKAYFKFWLYKAKSALLVIFQALLVLPFVLYPSHFDLLLESFDLYSIFENLTWLTRPILAQDLSNFQAFLWILFDWFFLFFRPVAVKPPLPPRPPLPPNNIPLRKQFKPPVSPVYSAGQSVAPSNNLQTFVQPGPGKKKNFILGLSRPIILGFWTEKKDRSGPLNSIQCIFKSYFQSLFQAYLRPVLDRFKYNL